MALLPCAAPPPELHVLAEVIYDGSLWWVKECRARFDVVGAVVTLDDFDKHGATVPHARCVFKDYVYELWSASAGKIMAFRHELEVVHNEPTLAAAAAWIKDGPNDPVKHRGLVPVRDTNVDHNLHTALVHLWSVHLLERFADDGTEFVQELLCKWEQGEVTSTFFPQRPEARSPSESEDEDSEGDKDDDSAYNSSRGSPRSAADLTQFV